MDYTHVIIDGHRFEVGFEFKAEVKPEGDEPFEEEELTIKSIFLGAYAVSCLFLEEAPELFDKIKAQVMAKIKEGDL